MSALSILFAFLRRDGRVALSYRASFALSALSILFLLALFFYLGRIVDNAEFASTQGLDSDYFAYAVVGLALLQILSVSMASFSRKLREEQTTGTFEALMATPASPSLIILASAAYDLLQAVFSAIGLILLAVVVFGLHLDTDPASLAVAATALVGCLGLFASLGVVIAAFTVVFKRATALLAMVISGLALLGGVYFPIDVLPPVIEAVARALPFTWGLDVLRASLLGGEVDPVQLAGLFGAAALLLPAALFAFGASVERARRTGSLAQY